MIIVKYNFTLLITAVDCISWPTNVEVTGVKWKHGEWKNKINYVGTRKSLDINWYKYRLIRQRRDGQIKWVCTLRTCYASLLTDSSRLQVLSIMGEHKHVLNTVKEIEQYIFRVNCKRKAIDSISIRPFKIIRSLFVHLPWWTVKLKKNTS